MKPDLERTLKLKQAAERLMCEGNTWSVTSTPSGSCWPSARATPPWPEPVTAGTPVPVAIPYFFGEAWIFLAPGSVEGTMTKKDKIAFIKSSRRKSYVYNDLHRYSDQQLDELIREIVQGLVRESELIANAYINANR